MSVATPWQQVSRRGARANGRKNRPLVGGVASSGNKITVIGNLHFDVGRPFSCFHEGR